MTYFTALLAAWACGIDVGWQPAPKGGFEYIIHVEPAALESLRDGLEIHSQVPPFLHDFRVCRIRVSDQAPPREGEPEALGPSGTQSTNGPSQSLLLQTPPLQPDDTSQLSGTSAAPSPPGELGEFLTRAQPMEAVRQATDQRPVPPDTAIERPALTNPLDNPFQQGNGPFQPGSGVRKQTPKTEPAVSQGTGPSATIRKGDAIARTPPRDNPWIDPTVAPSWLLGTALGLFVSLGGNAYLGWLAWGFRSRYERAIERLKQSLATGRST